MRREGEAWPRPPCEGCISTGTLYCTVPALFLATQVYVPESVILVLKIINMALAAMTRPPITTIWKCVWRGEGREGRRGGVRG